MRSVSARRYYETGSKSNAALPSLERQRPNGPLPAGGNSCAPLHLVSLSILGLSPFARVSRVAAQAPGPYVCMTRDFSKRVAYVSPIFNVPPGDAMKVNPAWNQVMTSQYAITALPSQSCQGPYPRNTVADSMRTKFITYIESTMKQKVL